MKATADSKLHNSSISAFVVLPSDFSGSARRGQIAPEVHLEGSQPSDSAPVLRAVTAALASAASQGGVSVSPKLSYLYGGPSLDTLDYFGGAFIGLIVFFLVFVVTSVAFLRERSQGTRERVMASPLRRSEIVVGYMLGFTMLALVQSLEVLLFAVYVLNVHNSGAIWVVFVVEILMAVAAVNLGIFLSMFARTEFQAVQFIPLVIVPQFLLSGVLFPVVSEPGWLQYVSRALPLTYAVDGLRAVMLKGADLSWGVVQLDAGVMLGFCLLLMGAAGLTLRRRMG